MHEKVFQWCLLGFVTLMISTVLSLVNGVKSHETGKVPGWISSYESRVSGVCGRAFPERTVYFLITTEPAAFCQPPTALFNHCCTFCELCKREYISLALGILLYALEKKGKKEVCGLRFSIFWPTHARRGSVLLITCFYLLY